MRARSAAKATLAAIAVAGLFAAPGSGQSARAAGFCSQLWQPVCAMKNGVRKTYSNAGCAKVDDAAVVAQGECEQMPTEPTPSY